MNSFKLFGFKRKLDIFYADEDFFELHSIATERKKDKNSVKKSNFLANRKSVNEFNVKHRNIRLFNVNFRIKFHKKHFGLI